MDKFSNGWTTELERLRAENRELLEACKWMVNVYCGIGKDGEPASDSEFEAAIYAGKAAIAKAGEK